MEMVIIFFMKLYFVITVLVMLAYAVRHTVFTYNRLYQPQKMYCQDILSSDIPFVSVLIPMHNEELVAHGVLDALLRCDYPADTEGNRKMEIVPINDFSEDKTREILDTYAAKYDCIHPIHRYSGDRGKPAALNEAMKSAKGQIIVVFDADYIPARGLLRELVVSFMDPEVGAVMGRVIPVNTEANILTRLLDLERSGGYQVDQQARYNLNLLPQYGGTVGGFRKDLILATGGFKVDILAEDTELTYRLACSGWKIVYANTAECYEEAPETWEIRAKQIRRWARGHNEVMFRYFGTLLGTKYLRPLQRIDALMLLTIYLMPVVLLLGLLDSLGLFFLGEMDIIDGWWVLLFIGAYNTFGNFAPFFEVGTANILDASRQRMFLLPYLSFNFYFYLWFITQGFFESVVDVLTKRKASWQKTVRFRQGGTGV